MATDCRNAGITSGKTKSGTTTMTTVIMSVHKKYFRIFSEDRKTASVVAASSFNFSSIRFNCSSINISILRIHAVKQTTHGCYDAL